MGSLNSAHPRFLCAGWMTQGSTALTNEAKVKCFIT